MVNYYASSESLGESKAEFSKLETAEDDEQAEMMGAEPFLWEQYTNEELVTGKPPLFAHLHSLACCWQSESNLWPVGCRCVFHTFTGEIRLVKAASWACSELLRPERRQAGAQCTLSGSGAQYQLHD